MSKHCPLGDREIGKALLLLRDREIERLQAENAALCGELTGERATVKILEGKLKRMQDQVAETERQSDSICDYNWRMRNRVAELEAANAALRKVVEAVQVVDDEHELDTESDLSPGIERLRAALSDLKEVKP